MIVAETIFSAVFNILSIYIGFRVIKIFLPLKEEFIIPPGVIYFFVWLINWGVYFVLDNVILTTSSLIIALFVATLLLYEGTLVQKIVAVVSEIALGMITENIVWIFLNNSSIFSVNAALGSLLSSFLFMVLVFVLERFFKMDNTDRISLGSYFNISVVMAGSAVIGEILVRLSVHNQELAMIGLTIICLIDVSTYYLYDKISEVYFQKIERKLNKQRILMYENQLALMKQSQKNIMSLQHDMRNHFLLLKNYLENHQYDNAEGYIQDISNYINVSGEYVHTENQEVDAILNYMLHRAKKISCTVETQIEIPDSPFMAKVDLNILLSNLLDNALEAVEKVDKPYLYIGLKYQKGLFIIRIYNTFNGIIIQNKKRYLTTKSDSENHGIGLQNVYDIIERYGGELKIEPTDTLFKVEVMLFLLD